MFICRAAWLLIVTTVSAFTRSPLPTLRLVKRPNSWPQSLSSPSSELETPLTEMADSPDSALAELLDAPESLLDAFNDVVPRGLMDVGVGIGPGLALSLCLMLSIGFVHHTFPGIHTHYTTSQLVTSATGVDDLAVAGALEGVEGVAANRAWSGAASAFGISLIDDVAFLVIGYFAKRKADDLEAA